MKTANRKITVLLPEELVRRATKSSGEGLTSTIKQGLELVAVRETFSQIKAIKGKYRKTGLGLSLEELREDKK